jgi:hypothetical protein
MDGWVAVSIDMDTPDGLRRALVDIRLQTGEDFSMDDFHRSVAGPPLMREVERREQQQLDRDQAVAAGCVPRVRCPALCSPPAPN